LIHKSIKNFLLMEKFEKEYCKGIGRKNVHCPTQTQGNGR
jgi:hypothetical protein